MVESKYGRRRYIVAFVYAVLELVTLLLGCVTVGSYIWTFSLVRERVGSRIGIAQGYFGHEQWEPSSLPSGMVGGGPWWFHVVGGRPLSWIGTSTGLGGASYWVFLMPMCVLCVALCIARRLRGFRA
jgi:hypothetical protein